MADDPKSPLAAADLPEIVRQIRARTPARILVGRAGAAYRTKHSAGLARRPCCRARRSPRRTRSPHRTSARFSQSDGDFSKSTRRQRSKDEFLMRPDLGRHFGEAARAGNHEALPARLRSSDRDRRRPVGARRRVAGSRVCCRSSLRAPQHAAGRWASHS